MHNDDSQDMTRFTPPEESSHQRDTRPEAATGLPSGLRSIGPYEIVREIGRGGMGVVYEVRRPDLGKTFALKAMLAGAQEGGEALTRFEREARALARIDQHPNIVKIWDVGKVETGQGSTVNYFTMEFVEGGSLDDALDEVSFPQRRTAELAAKIARALSHAHSNGVIHRDIKPANILLTRDGEPKITDFGLARDKSSLTRLTTSGTAMGTPVYMSPEQAEGSVSGADERSDVYSLGALLYEMLTGQPPFEGESVAAVIFKVIHKEPARPRRINSEIHPELEAICLKALDKEKRRRYATAADMADDLERWVDGRPVKARPPGAILMLLRRARKNRALALMGLVALLAVGGAVALGVRYSIDAASRAKAEASRKTAEREAVVHFEEGLKILEQADRYRFIHGVPTMEVSRLLKDAEASFTRALEAYPDHAQSLYQKARIKGLQARYNAAEKDLSRCLEIMPDFPPALILRGEVRIYRSQEIRGGLRFSGRVLNFDGTVHGTLRAEPYPDCEEARAKRLQGMADLARARFLTGDKARLSRLEAVAAISSVEGGGDIGEAISAIERAVAADPTNPDNLIDRARYLGFAGRLEESLADAQKAAQLAPNYFLTCLMLADAYILNSRFEEAIEAAERGFGFHPGHPSLMRSIGWARIMQSKYSEAVSLLEKVRDDSSSLGMNELGICYFGLAEFEKARETFEKLAKLCPDISASWVNLGAALLMLGREREALPALDRAVELAGGESMYHAMRGVARSRSGDLKGGEEDYRESLRRDPGRVTALLNLAVNLQKQGRFDEAAGVNKEALKIKPDNPTLWANLGEAYRRSGEFDKAMEAFDRALEREPSNFVARYGRGMILTGRRDGDAAVRELMQALEIRPDSSEAMKAVAKAEMVRKNFREAIEWYGRALERNPNDLESLYERGITWTEVGEWGSAKADIDDLLSREPRHEKGLLARAGMLLETGKREEALAVLAELEKIAPDMPALHQNRARILVEQKKHAAAIPVIDRVIELESGPKKFWYTTRAQCRFFTGDFAAAADDAGMAVAEDPSHVMGYVWRGFSRLRLSDAEGALADFGKAVEIEPKAEKSLKGSMEQARKMLASRK